MKNNRFGLGAILIIVGVLLLYPIVSENIRFFSTFTENFNAWDKQGNTFVNGTESTMKINGSSEYASLSKSFVAAFPATYLVKWEDLAKLSDAAYKFTVETADGIVFSDSTRDPFLWMDDGNWSKAVHAVTLNIATGNFSITFSALGNQGQVDISNVTVASSLSWAGFSLDGMANVTLAGNSTLTGLAKGMHHLVLYANSTEDIFASEEVYFTVAYDSPPEIQHTPVESAEEGSAIEIFALITDDTGIASAQLFYRKAGQTSFLKLEMTKWKNKQKSSVRIEKNILEMQFSKLTIVLV